MFATIEAEGWVLILGAFFLGVGKVVEIILQYKREQEKIARELAAAIETKKELAHVAEKVAEVATDAKDAVDHAKFASEVASKAHDVILKASEAQTAATEAQGEKLDAISAFLNGASITQLQTTLDALDRLAKESGKQEDAHTASVAREFLRKRLENLPK